MTAPVDLAELERLEREASASPWKLGWDDTVDLEDPGACWYDSRDNGSERQYWATGPSVATVALARVDTAFIVALRNSAPELLRELHRLRARNEELRKAHLVENHCGGWLCVLCHVGGTEWRTEAHAPGCLAAPEGATE